ncbi:nitroreductase/quinone reductase family protein [Promicromonospora thailandica]|uniref:Deazaflavin-dependent oxidoreductase, nitroreductase family n=1 Tax=Promicromonospora thailandica TaxID=765201 RepID=A0A9X2GCJ5_9MICO|nr:nitroreductase/quinone reductase family protein [Promicromonospora thailandica]MCP2266681.1 deazaflavin-dependent oxidoreductase, nitroreductase family [Promicromonospora thailandica]BFF17234.1 hypothetical protein GCM10025730_07550 [Promicromonospora thailandica]
MSFSHPTGTRGARPPGPMFRRVNRVLAWFARRSRRSLLGTRVLVLTTVGRRTGEPRATPLAWFPGPDGTWRVVASNWGAATNPAWYLNVAAHPDRLTVETGGRTVPVRARELHGAERAEAWRQITARAANFRRYEQGTDREIPVIDLTPR